MPQDRCVVVLADGSPCTEIPLVGRYCADHDRILDRDFEIFKLITGHFQQDLREFWPSRTSTWSLMSH
jgi:hypothetical protein